MQGRACLETTTLHSQHTFPSFKRYKKENTVITTANENASFGMYVNYLTWQQQQRDLITKVLLHADVDLSPCSRHT